MPPKPSEPTLSPQQLRANIAAGRVGPLYLIEGTDEVLKSELAGLFADAIEPELRAFNVERLYGTDTSLEPRSIADAVKTLPMMAPRRVVVVLQAERVLTPPRESETSDGALKPLVECIEQPVDSTTLVFVTHEPLNGTRRVTKLLNKHATRVECGGLGPSAQLAREIEERAAEIGVTVDRAAVARLIAARWRRQRKAAGRHGARPGVRRAGHRDRSARRAGGGARGEVQRSVGADQRH